MESLIGRKVKMKYDFPLDNEVFEIIGERKNEVEIQGDFSAGTHNVCQSQWESKEKIKEFPPNRICKEKINGSCPHHNLHCAYPKCEE